MSTVSFLSQLYTNLLGRNPDASGLAWWADVIDSGRANAAEVTRDFIDSPEFGGVVQPLARLYYAAFGRIPDASGLQYWTHNAQGGQSYADIVKYFAASPEFAKLYGQLDSAAFLDALSTTALGHSMDTTARAGWLDKLASGSATRADVLSSVVSSSEMAAHKAAEVKAIAAFYGTLGTMPGQADLAAAVATSDPAALITKLYASAAYQGVAAPGLIAHGTITDAFGHGATVFIDTNANGVLDAGEVSVKADGAGNFDFGTSAAFKGQLTVQGANGASFTAPSGATVVNALTTLVQGVAASQHLDTAAAEQLVRSALGLGSADLLHTDFTATAADLTLAPSTRDQAAKVQATAAQLEMVISQTSAALQGLGLAADAVSAGAAAVQAVSTFIANPTRQGAADLADSGAIQTMVKAAGALLKASPAQLAVLNLAAPELAKVIVNVNSALAQASGSAAWETINKIGTIEANAATVLAKLAGGDISGALGLATLPALTKALPIVMSGGGEGISTSGPPSLTGNSVYTDAMRLAFSEDVFAGSGKIIITDGDSQTHYNSSTGKLETRAVGGTDTRVLDIHDSHVTIEDNMVWITFDTPLSTSKSYHLIINPGALVDTDYNAFTGRADASAQYPTYNPTVSASATALSANYLSPNSNIKAGDDAIIRVTFDQSVTVSGSPTLALTGGRTATYVSGSGSNTLVFKYTVTSGEETSLGMVTGGGAGLAGQVKSGAGLLLDSAHIAFTDLPLGYGTVHIDGVKPTYTVTMDKAALDATHNTATVTVTFSEDIQQSTFLASDVTVSNGTLGSWTRGADGKTYTATFTAAGEVSDSTNVITYTPTALKDWAGNVAISTAASTSNFTIDTKPPVALLASNVANNAPFAIQFDEAVYASGTGEVVLTKDDDSTVHIPLANVTFSADHKTMTLVDAGVLVPGHQYSVTLPPELKDGGGNPLSSGTYWFQVTTDGKPSALSARFLDYSGGTYHVGDQIQFEVEFNENVFVSGTPKIQLETGTVDQYAEYTTGSGSNTLRFSYTVHEGDSQANLVGALLHDLSAMDGLIKNDGDHFLDTAHIVFDHIDGSYGTSTIKLDGIAPTAGTNLTLDPDTHENNLYSNTLNLNFDEAVNFTHGSIELHDAGTNAVVATWTGTSSSTHPDWTISGNSLQLKLPANGAGIANPGHFYIITVGHPIHDTAGNDFAGYSGASDLNFIVPVTA
ncbi:DUF4214 domain-containing protein [Massilia arenosa]|uniref:DUF4214 domain-containing protein n=1 Tax=Zemynaea arenosa TaxID=2561931 RepID=A0A4Y9S6V0_9BURK|nr:DUF4214 domain-containing protein [Massilia arenosa]TFW17227.1 DUF4214 domain-containing protein [Massilia arenosa]